MKSLFHLPPGRHGYLSLLLMLIGSSTMLLASSVPAVAQQGAISGITAGSGAAPGNPSGISQTALESTGILPGTTAQTVVTQNVVSTSPVSTQVTQLNVDCGHVVELLIANRFRQNTFQNGSELAPGLLLGTPGQQRLGDLELLSLHSDGSIDPRNGPIFEIAMRNDSEVALENVTVSAVAVLGQINVQSPTTVISVRKIAAGEFISLRIQLPAASMVMGPTGSPVVPFETLVVAINSFDELVESNELNNVRIIRRSDIPMIPVAVVAQEVPAVAPQTSQVSESGTLPPIAGPEESKPVSPLDAIDPDKLGDDTAQPQ